MKKDFKKNAKQKVFVDNGIITPNMFIENGDMRESTIHKTVFAGSIIAESSLEDCQLLDVNIKSSTIAQASLENSKFTHCSFKNVVLEGCDVSGLVINGVRVGDLFINLKSQKQEK